MGEARMQQRQEFLVQSVQAQLGFVYWPSICKNAASVIKATPTFYEQSNPAFACMYVLGKHEATAIPPKYMRNMEMKLDSDPASRYFKVEWTPPCMDETQTSLPFYVGLLQDGSRCTVLTEQDKSCMTMHIEKLHVLQGWLHVHQFLHVVLVECLRIGAQQMAQDQWQRCGAAPDAEFWSAQQWTQQNLNGEESMYNWPSHVQEAKKLLDAFKADRFATKTAWARTLSRVIRREQESHVLLEVLLPGQSTSSVVVEWFCTALAKMLHIVTQSIQMAGVRNAAWLGNLDVVLQNLFPHSQDDWKWYASQLQQCIFLEATEPCFGPTDHEAIASSCPTLLRGMSGIEKRNITWTFYMLQHKEGVKWLERHWSRVWQYDLGCKKPPAMPLQRFIEGYWTCLEQPVGLQHAAELRMRGLLIETRLDGNGLMNYLREQIVTKDVAVELKMQGFQVTQQMTWHEEQAKAQRFLAGSPPHGLKTAEAKTKHEALEVVDACNWSQYFHAEHQEANVTRSDFAEMYDFSQGEGSHVGENGASDLHYLSLEDAMFDDGLPLYASWT